MHSLEKYAKEENVPIIQKDGLEFILNYIKENNVKSILEIGTAIAYSAINFANVSDDIKVTTIERNEKMYHEALKNVKKFSKEKQITIIYGDALDINIEGKFDLIFIDAAKAQYIKFFEKYKCNLKETGTIISDNLDFHGLASNVENIESKNLKQLMKKLNNYKNFLKENYEFETKFYSIGDGISVSKKNQKK